jgi:hypothetical protein
MAVNGHPVNRFARLLDFYGIALLTQGRDESHKDLLFCSKFKVAPLARFKVLGSRFNVPSPHP